MNEQEENTTQAAKPKSAKDRVVKIAFLVIAMGAAGTIYMMQRKDPELRGWGRNLGEALREAKARQTKVVVLFTRSPMGYNDKKMVKRCMRLGPTVRVLRHLGYPKVHLRTQADESEVQRYHVTKSPTVLLLDSDGKVLKKHEGFMTDLSFCNNMLGVSAASIPKAQPSANGR